jgi:hypothetical protein
MFFRKLQRHHSWIASLPVAVDWVLWDKAFPDDDDDDRIIPLSSGMSIVEDLSALARIGVSDNFSFNWVEQANDIWAQTKLPAHHQTLKIWCNVQVGISDKLNPTHPKESQLQSPLKP